MPKYNVMVNRTRTIEESYEMEVSAKNEEAAQEKVEAMVSKYTTAGNLEEKFNFEESDQQVDYEYDVTEL